MPRFFQYLLGFAVLVLLQEFVLASINVYGFVSITIYIMALLLLPMEITGAKIMFIAALMGATVDIFQGTAAIATMCFVWIGFVRHTVLNLTLGRDIVIGGGMPRSVRIGAGHFFRYIIVMCFMYAIPYFLLEMMSFENLTFTVIRTFVSAISTAVLIYVLHLPFSRKGSFI